MHLWEPINEGSFWPSSAIGAQKHLESGHVGKTLAYIFVSNYRCSNVWIFSNLFLDTILIPGDPIHCEGEHTAFSLGLLGFIV